MQNRTLNYVTSCLIVVGTIIALFNNFEMMLTDSDTAWHLMAGDLIRSSGTVPQIDPWAFTSAGAPWINLAWLWDVWMSILHQHLGWHGQIAFVGMCVGLTMALLYNACLLRSGSGIASFFAIMFVMISIPLHLRSLWVTNLFMSLLFLLALLVQYRGWSVLWWYAMPALMPLWVNVHGGFVTAFTVLGAFGLQALVQKQWRLAAHLTAAGLLSIAALGISPYGYKGVLDVIVATFTTPYLAFIGEFRPSAFSWSFLLSFSYIPVFLFCAIHQKIKTSLAEAILGFGFILLAATSERYWTFVFLFSCPLLAQYFTGYIKEGRQQGNQTAMRMAEQAKRWIFILHARSTCVVASLLMVAGIAFLFSPPAARMSGLAAYNPYSIFLPAVKFVQTHYPRHRFLNDYELGGALIAASGGSFPVFIDGRGETAYPRKLVADFGDMMAAKPGWEKIFDTYDINGVILINYRKTPIFLPRFEERRGWKPVFADDSVSIYVRE